MHRPQTGFKYHSITCEFRVRLLKETNSGYLYIGNILMHYVAKSKLGKMLVISTKHRI